MIVIKAGFRENCVIFVLYVTFLMNGVIRSAKARGSSKCRNVYQLRWVQSCGSTSTDVSSPSIMYLKS